MRTFSYNYSDALALLPKRLENSNKGTYGRVLIIGGSKNMCGASYFSAKAALRTGAGLVEILAPEENRVILQTLIPEAVLTTYGEDFFDFSASLDKATVIAIGMGLSKSEKALSLLEFTLKNRKCPIIIDADGLNLLAENEHLLKLATENQNAVIITPHLYEMARLCKNEPSKIAKDIKGVAQYFADEHNLICVLKDHNTAVALPYSESIYINKSGNGGMSTAGAGDVLDGIIAGLLTQGLNAYDAATLGVHLHGLSGDIASSELSEYSVIASDIIDCLPKVLKMLTNHNHQ